MTRQSARSGAIARGATILGAVLALALAGPGSATSASAANSPVSPHGPYGSSLTVDACGGCHRAHTGKSPALLPDVAPQSKLCFTCHDGTGAAFDVKSEYTASTLKANDETTSSYYSHDALVVTTHTLSTADEFSGVKNRHTECSDCHDPHDATAAPSTSSPAGTPWTPSGATAGTSGLTVVYDPTYPFKTNYTFVDGTTDKMTAEYQLCFKCHSGSTVLLSNPNWTPSQQMLDVAVEFNPTSSSYHPVEAAGRNQTPKMALSLSGDSPFKLWNFTPSSTVRCTNCHAGSGAFANKPAEGGTLAPHTSAYRGILLQAYEDRVLRTAGDPYNSADFALCFLCHTDTPFKNGGGTKATNFSKHSFHMNEIWGVGDNTGPGVGLSIDNPGDGDGNALCAECHFRPHSTATSGQNSALVSFAPNVTPGSNGLREFRSTGVGSGQCSLTCHGVDHKAWSYSATP